MVNESSSGQDNGGLSKYDLQASSVIPSPYDAIALAINRIASLDDSQDLRSIVGTILANRAEISTALRTPTHTQAVLDDLHSLITAFGDPEFRQQVAQSQNIPEEVSIQLAELGISLFSENLSNFQQFLQTGRDTNVLSRVMDIASEVLSIDDPTINIPQRDNIIEFMLNNFETFVNRIEDSQVLLNCMTSLYRHAGDGVEYIFSSLANNETIRQKVNFTLISMIIESDMHTHQVRQLAAIVLRSYGLSPNEFFDFWEQDLGDVGRAAVMKRRIQFNLIAILNIEGMEKGAMVALAEEGVRNPGSYDLDTLMEQYKNRNRHHPRTLLRISPQDDHNGAFLFYHSKLSTESRTLLADREFVTHVADTNSPVDLEELINQFIKEHGEQEEVILVLGGHGTNYGIQLGEDMFFAELTVRDFDSPGCLGWSLLSKLGKRVHIVLASCSTGKQANGRDNIAQAMSRHPNVVEVIASDKESKTQEIDIKNTDNEELKARVVYIDGNTLEEFEGSRYVNGELAA